MNFSQSIAPLWDIWLAIKIGLLPTLLAILFQPTLVLRPKDVRQFFFARVWETFGPGIDEHAKPIKMSLLPNAHGVVLELGAGHGTSMLYFDRKQVSRYVALEPNKLMHPEIRKNAAVAGFDESRGDLLILGCGAEDFEIINSALGGENHADTIITILSLCQLEQPQKSIANLVSRVLKPGGQFLFYEHILSPHKDVREWQRLWAPIWYIAFDGCHMDYPSHEWLLDCNVWDEEKSKVWAKPEEPEEHLFAHRIGHLVKTS